MIEFALLALVAGMGSGALMPESKSPRRVDSGDVVALVLSLALAVIAATCFIVAICTAPWGSIR